MWKNWWRRFKRLDELSCCISQARYLLAFGLKSVAYYKLKNSLVNIPSACFVLAIKLKLLLRALVFGRSTWNSFPVVLIKKKKKNSFPVVIRTVLDINPAKRLVMDFPANLSSDSWIAGLISGVTDIKFWTKTCYSTIRWQIARV